MDRMVTFKKALLRQLDLQGWRRVAVEPLRPSYQVGELWTLESQRQPQGLRTYLAVWEHYAYRYGGGGVSVDLHRHRPDGPWPVTDEHLFFGRVGREEARLVTTALGRWRSRLATEQADNPDSGPDAPVGVFDANAWRSASDAEQLLADLGDRLSERKLRLFACACCRHLPSVMDDPRNVRAVETAERYADGSTPKRELKKARKAADIPWLDTFEPREEAVQAIRAAVRYTLPAERGFLCELLRDLSGNPFLPATPFKPSWLRANGGAVGQLARVIYNEGRFEDLPILADALEDASCTNGEMLEHCRQSGLHARGCFLLDLLLERR
jgi:hypothetical protein